MLFVDFWLKVDMASCNGMAFRTSISRVGKCWLADAMLFLMGLESAKANGLKLCFSLIFGWMSIWPAVMAWLFGLVCRESENADVRMLCFSLNFGWTSIWPAVMAWLFGLLCQLFDWLCLYRAIDEPALQDVLAWNDFEPDLAVLRNCCLHQVEWVSFDSLAVCEGCGLIADG